MLAKSYFAVGINEILKQVGVPKGSFYNYFSSKEDFGIACIDYYVENHRQFLSAHFARSNGTALERILSYYRMLEQMHQHGSCNVLCLVAKLSTEVSNLSPAMAVRLAQGMKGWIKIMQDCIAKGQQAGEITKQMSAESIAQWMYDTWNGAMMRMQVQQSRDPLVNALSLFEKVLPA